MPTNDRPLRSEYAALQSLRVAAPARIGAHALAPCTVHRSARQPGVLARVAAALRGAL